MSTRTTDRVRKFKLCFDFAHLTRDAEVVSGPRMTQAAEESAGLPSGLRGGRQGDLTVKATEQTLCRDLMMDLAELPRAVTLSKVAKGSKSSREAFWVLTQLRIEITSFPASDL